ncbi:histidinol dehydrogenase [Congzhengia minquanensis]|uniref:Histidinol dehydrogenase n=1 Tax=Congzhengia minquanensis TaxID=2763657 RepID=A0A926DNU0_9FIRM|nr:histidinol dehydrogenase [Congzhengia minquanensis]MBC8541771.1 histidinol dehydrogenase [Congzhengia minquanensis]
MIQILNYDKIRCDKITRDEIFAQAEEQTNVADVVSEIIKTVREEGDSALFAYCEKFDKAVLDSLEVPQSEIDAAFAQMDETFIKVLSEAKENITQFHSRQVRSSFIINETDGVVTGQKIIPIEKVGLYVPGGTAAYPSSVLMNAIPAKIAGVKEIVMVTPPTGGSVNPAILAAAKIAGVDRVFKIGGAQAVAALAYGTESVPKVDKIVGPGNAYVAEAKRQVFGRVAIDMIAGPSEILVVADEKSNPKYVAADLLSQAEHDKNASAVLICTSQELAVAVQQEIEMQLSSLPREEIARASIESNGKIIVTSSIADAISVANEIAPEHLELCMDNPFDYLDKIKNAGSIFMGRFCPEALGDYFAGPNHTLPTSGTARFSSPLSVDDFVKKSQYTYYTDEAFSKIADKVAYFAEKEGLSAHARSATVRKSKR